MNQAQQAPMLQDPMIFNTDPYVFIPVDKWEPRPQDMYFKTIRGALIMDVSGYLGQEPNMDLDSFILSTKRSYNSVKMRDHMVQYLNYFETYYDTGHELQVIMSRIKYMIDCEPYYSKEAFIHDLKRYLMTGRIALMVKIMVEDNFLLNLTYKNQKNPNLQYNNKHGKVLMHCSMMMNIIIPLLCHFMYSRKVQNSSEFLLEVYDVLIGLYDVDIYSKLYETATSNVEKSAKKNSALWAQQDIRGINKTTHTLQSVINILLNILPKYVFEENLVNFNFRSIVRNTGFYIAL